jgi:hypothetical protein
MNIGSLCLASHIPIESVLDADINNPNNSYLARRSTAPIIFHENNNELVYSAPNTVKIKIKFIIFLNIYLAFRRNLYVHN